MLATCKSSTNLMIIISQRQKTSERVFQAHPDQHGFSLTEMIATISMLAILAGIALVMLNGAFDSSKENMAINRMEMVNKALDSYMTNVAEIIWPENAGSTSDELTVLAGLRHRSTDTNKIIVGSPFIDPNYNPKASSDSTTYRLRWRGKRFELLRPGVAGTGLRIPFDGTDMGGNPPTVDPSKVFGK
jgi:prepilin-type N-terminal cleavage/methylation domain-containing protein